MYSQVHADIDGGASMTMTPHASLISEGQQCNMSIKIADGSVLTSNIKKGFLDATCNGKLLPKIEALHVLDLAATLISSPQLVLEGNMDIVDSKHYGSFMQPACDSCPICTPHVDRIMIATPATDMSISITPCDTYVSLGKSEQALEFTSSTRTVTSEYTIELIKLCHCCRRSSMKRSAAPPSISREVSPLEEVHLDIFTFNVRYTVYLMDRGS